jgi:hypothetical protein
MADVYTRAERSALMAKVRGRGNLTTELALAKLLRARGWSGWRRQQVVRGRAAAGERFQVRPDFVFPARGLVVFVDGFSGMAVRGMVRGRGATPPSGGRSSGETRRGIVVIRDACGGQGGGSCASGSMN